MLNNLYFLEDSEIFRSMTDRKVRNSISAWAVFDSEINCLLPARRGFVNGPGIIFLPWNQQIIVTEKYTLKTKVYKMNLNGVSLCADAQLFIICGQRYFVTLTTSTNTAHTTLICEFKQCTDNSYSNISCLSYLMQRGSLAYEQEKSQQVKREEDKIYQSPTMIKVKKQRNLQNKTDKTYHKSSGIVQGPILNKRTRKHEYRISRSKRIITELNDQMTKIEEMGFWKKERTIYQSRHRDKIKNRNYMAGHKQLEYVVEIRKW